jgi:hypothetical protein
MKCIVHKYKCSKCKYAGPCVLETKPVDWDMDCPKSMGIVPDWKFTGLRNEK